MHMKKNLLTTLFLSACISSSVFAQYAWNNVGSGTNFTVQSLTGDTAINTLYVGGVFTQAGPVPTIGIAKWDGVNYSALDQGILVGTGISAMIMQGSNLIAGGSFTNISGATSKNIAQWNGAAWLPLGAGLDTSGGQAIVSALAIYNNELYAGGIFNKSGSTVLNYIAKWDGVNWQPVGTGTNGKVSSLCVYNGELYAGGTFTSAGGTPVKNIARWNGAAWNDVGGGVDYTGAISVSALQTYSTSLYAGGVFTTAGLTSVKNIARWDGANWFDVGGGTSNYTGAISVSALEVFQGNLVAGGGFDSLGGNHIKHVAKWNGTAWSALGSGMNNNVLTLKTLRDTLYAGGIFTVADASTSLFISQWKPTPASVMGDISYQSERFNLYPNPVQNKLWISGNATMNQNKVLNFTLYDPLGREIIKKENVRDEINFEGRNISPGLYFYKITDKNNVVLKEGKIIFAD
jgi:hypothetical protein